MNIKTNVFGENRAERFRNREELEKKEKEESMHRWESIVRKLAKIFAIKLADMLLKDTFEKLVPHQSEAILDVAKFLIAKSYKNINEYFDVMISKTKYKAMLPELKELDINIWDLLPNKLDGFFDVLENYIKQQGFSIMDGTASSYYVIKWHMLSEEVENVSQNEWNEFWKLVQICAYHHKLEDIIYERSDTRDDDDDDDDEWNKTYATLMKKYGVSNWRDALDIAKKFHYEKVKEYTAKIDAWKNKYGIFINCYVLLDHMGEDSEFNNWLYDLDVTVDAIGEDLNEKECYNIGKPSTLVLDRVIKG